MDAREQAIIEIEASPLGAERWRTARRLLDRSDDNGACYMSYDDLTVLTGCGNVRAALRHLTELAAADVIHYSTNEIVYISFRAWTRSNGASTRSNGASTRSNGASTRSNGASTRSNGASPEGNDAAIASDDEPLLLLLLNNNNNAVVVEENNNNNNAPVAAVVDEVGEVAAVEDVDESLQTLLAEVGFVVAAATVAGWVKAHGAPHVEKAIRLAGERKAKRPERYIEGIFGNWLAKGYPAIERTRDFSRYTMEMATLPESSEATEVADPGEPEAELIDQTLWDRAKEQLQLQLASSTYYTWLADTWAVEWDEQFLTVATGSTYARDWLQHRLRSVVKRTVKNIVGHAVEVEFVVRPRG